MPTGGKRRGAVRGGEAAEAPIGAATPILKRRGGAGGGIRKDAGGGIRKDAGGGIREDSADECTACAGAGAGMYKESGGGMGWGVGLDSPAGAT